MYNISKKFADLIKLGNLKIDELYSAAWIFPFLNKNKTF